MKLIEKIFYYGGCLAYGFTYFIKVAVKKALDETLSQLPPRIEHKSIYEEEIQPLTQEITENNINTIKCINCKEKSLRIESVKCKKCGFVGKFTPLYRNDK